MTKDRFYKRLPKPNELKVKNKQLCFTETNNTLDISQRVYFERLKAKLIEYYQNTCKYTIIRLIFINFLGYCKAIPDIQNSDLITFFDQNHSPFEMVEVVELEEQNHIEAMEECFSQTDFNSVLFFLLLFPFILFPFLLFAVSLKTALSLFILVLFTCAIILLFSCFLGIS